MQNNNKEQEAQKLAKEASYKKTKFTLVLILLFSAAALIQLIVPAKIVVNQERILTKGSLYKLKLNPVDPVDALRGRYVILNFAENKLELSASEFLEFSARKLVYAIYTADEQGFLHLTKLKARQPSADEIFIKTRLLSIYPKQTTPKCRAETQKLKKQQIKQLSAECLAHKNKHIAILDYAFDRFYLQEFKAQKVDKIFAQLNQKQAQEGQAFVLIRIKDGAAALQDLIIQQKSVMSDAFL